MVYEDDATLAFMDLRQPAGAVPGHLLVIPKAHTATLYDLEPEPAARVFQAVATVARAMRRALPEMEGLSVWQSNGAPWQEVFHLHVHLMPRRRGDGLFHVYQVPPAEAERAALDELAARVRAGLG